MLYTYSTDALTENWLNSIIVNFLIEGFQAIVAGQPLPSWPKDIPEEKRDIVKGRSGIKKRVLAVWAQFANLDPVTQQSLLGSALTQTEIPEVLNNNKACATISNFPTHFEEPAVDLFRFLFEKQLNSITVNQKNLRDIHYNALYDQMPSRICAFCGLGFFRAPGAPRHDLDHYMAITKYPFVGADFKNLAPMCGECNSDFKKNVDILTDVNGTRVQCVDPYLGPTYTISLARSKPFAGIVQKAIRLPLWNIDFIGGGQAQAQNWNRVFKIEERYKRDILDAEFRSWLQHFSYWYVGGNHGASTGEEIFISIPEYIDTVVQDGLSDRAFLKKEVFSLLYNECLHANRGADMKAFLEALVINA